VTRAECMSPLIGSAYIGIEGLDASTAESAEHTDRSRSPDDPYGSTPVYECRDQSRFDGSVPVKFPQAMVTFPDMAVRILECSYRETTQLLETRNEWLASRVLTGRLRAMKQAEKESGSYGCTGSIMRVYAGLKEVHLVLEIYQVLFSDFLHLFQHRAGSRLVVMQFSLGKSASVVL
jgi:hypothetical protein